MGASRFFAVACAFASLGAPCKAETRDFLGFRLLVLENRVARWPSGATLTYAFVTAPMTFPGARNCSSMVPLGPALARSRVTPFRFRSEAAAAFRMWEAAANISFREAADAGRADIVIGAQAEPRGRAFTNVKLKDGAKDGAPAIEQSLICLNPEVSWKVGFDGDLAVYDLRYALAHEAGHAIGLDHPAASGQLMGYRYDERSHGLQPGDMAGAARLYGAKTPARLEAAGSAPSLRAPANAAARKPSALGLGE